MDRRRRLSFALAVLVGGAMTACSEVSSAPQEIKREPIAVVVEAVTEVTEPITVRRSAAIRTRVDVVLVAESAGVLATRPPAAGAAVTKGAVIARLTDEAERAAVKAARSRLAGLIDAGTSLAAREEAESALQSTLEVLRRRTVIAPSAGVIDRYDAEVGDYLIPGAPIGRLVDPTRLWAIATVLEEEILLVQRGSAVTFTVPALPGETFTGTVVRCGRAALPGSGQFEVEFDIDPDPRVLPGFVATASIPLQGSRPVRSVSKDAVFTRHGTSRLFAVATRDGGDFAEERTIVVRSIPGHPGKVDVLSGVEPGTRVVVRGRIGLMSGDPLHAKTQR